MRITSRRRPTYTCSSLRSPWPSRTRPPRATRSSAVGVLLEERRLPALDLGAPARVAMNSADGRRVCSKFSSTLTAIASGAPKDEARSSRAAPRSWNSREPRRRSPSIVPDSRRRARRRTSARSASRQAPHLHRPVDRPRPWRLSDEAPGARPSRDHRDDPEVDVRRETPVELDLGLARRRRASSVAEVEEAEADRLLHLDRVLAGQEHPRDVRLAQLDRRGHRARPSGVGRGIEQVVTERAHDGSNLTPRQGVSTHRSPADRTFGAHCPSIAPVPTLTLLRAASRLSLVACLAAPLLAQTGCGGGPSVLGSDDLPVRRVVLYRNGVGYFERRGRFDGDELDVPCEAVRGR